MIPLTFSPDVAAARAEGRPLVALESTIITHGMPYPGNLETAIAVDGSLEVVEKVRFAAGLRNLQSMLLTPEVGRAKVFLGYSGWAPGQLAQEIAAGYWEVRRVEAAHLFDPDPATQWARITAAGRAI